VDSLQRIKIRLGLALEDTSQDPLIEIRSSDAADFFRGYCRRKKIPDAAAGLVERLVVWGIQTPGSIQSEKIGDTSVTYRAADIPVDLLRELNRYRRIGAG
jgi:hypothetical protein